MRTNAVDRITASLMLIGVAAATAAGAEGPAVEPLPTLLPPTLASTENARAQLVETIREAARFTKQLDAALDRGATPTPTAAEPPPKAAAATATATEPETARAEATERLKALEKAGTAEAKEVRELLEARLKLLDEWDRESASLHESEHPKLRPEREADDLKGQIERSRAALAQGAKEPDSLLPELFQVAPEAVTDAALKEMKGAIDAAEESVKDRKAARDGARGDSGHKPPGHMAELRIFREGLRKRRDDHAARNPQTMADVAGASTVEARALARDRLVNDQWEERVVALQLQAVEAAIALETRREPLADLRQQERAAACELAGQTLQRMKARYRQLAERQQRDLSRKAAAEQDRSVRCLDPLERFRAGRTAELLELESQLLRDERALASRPGDSTDDQRAMADRAQEDYEHLKALVAGGHSNALVATRLNNSYRRTASERERIVRQDLARAVALLDLYENALTGVELDQLNEARDDHAPAESVLESLPRGRKAEAQALIADLDSRRRTLLADRRQALQRLATQAEATQQQVRRRIRILEEQHAFIRTHIFWLRDAPPVGQATVEQAVLESRRVFQAGLRIAREPADRSRWGRTSWEFRMACLGLVLLPWPLAMTRRAFRPPSAA